VKWFKHYSDSLDSNSLRELKRNFGFEGLGRYWAFIEHLQNRWDDYEKEPFFEIQREDLRDLFGIRSWNGLETFADHLATIPGIDVIRSGNVYEINAPILLKLLHSDFKKTRTVRGQIPPKNKNKEIRTKNKNKTPISPLKNSASKNKDTIKIIDSWNSEQIIIHKVSDKLILDVAKLIKAKKLSASDILKAIENYKFILSNKNFIWTHKWSLKEFLKRENAEKFFPGEFNLDRFPKSQNSKAKERQDNMLSMRNPYAQT